MKKAMNDDSSKKMDFLIKKPKSVFLTKNPYSNPRKDFLREHLEELEHRLETSKLTKVRKEQLNKKINFLKKQL